MREKEETNAVTFCGREEYQHCAVFAVAYFSPAAAVPVVIGMLFQQVLASVWGLIMDRHFNKQQVFEKEKAM